MKINPSYMFNSYQKTASVSNPSANPSAAASLSESRAEQSFAKVDTIRISSQGNNQELLSSLSHKISSEIAGDYSSSRLNSIKQAVANGSYQISSGDVAKAMLAHAMI